jgi:hypothetical protein
MTIRGISTGGICLTAASIRASRRSPCSPGRDRTGGNRGNQAPIDAPRRCFGGPASIRARGVPERSVPLLVWAIARAATGSAPGLFSAAGGVSPNRRKFRRPPAFQISMVGAAAKSVWKGHQTWTWCHQLSVFQPNYGKSKARGPISLAMRQSSTLETRMPEFSAVWAYTPRMLPWGRRQAARRRRAKVPRPTSALPSNIRLAGSGTESLPRLPPMTVPPRDATAPEFVPLLRSAEK